MITIDGLNSGLDTEAVIQGLLDIQQTHLDRLSLRKQSVLNEQAAFQSLEAQLVTFRSTAARLGRTQNNVFESRTVSVSDETAVVASADVDATIGTYLLTVESLAQAHQIASQGYTDADAEITQGTFTIRQGSRPAVDITIDDGNNTLQSLADSINLSDAGITASIVQDGSDSGTPFRLLLTSSKSGEANAISVTNGLAVSSGGAVQPDFDFLNPVQAAANSEVRLGTGPGALIVESENNRVENLIGGVTLDLLEADAGKTISLRIGQDSESAVGAVEEFVDSYNSLIDFISQQTQFVPETGDAGLLLGNRSLIQIQAEIQNALQTVIPGLDSRANRLSTIGMSFTDTGKLTLNSAQLSQVLDGDVEGISSKDLRSLFALDATSSNPNIQFVLGSTRTREPQDPIEVDVTRAAERASIQSTNVLSTSTIINDTNNQLSLTVDGASFTVQLANGTYDETQLAKELEAVINAHPDMLGRSVSIGLQDNGVGLKHLKITSDTYGGSSQITTESGSALLALGLTGVENDQGVDVEGHFLINGVMEEATGRGRVLSGKSDNEFTADLQIKVTLSTPQLTAGVDGELTISRGFASRMDQLIGGMIDSQTGVLQSIDDRYTQDADSIQDAIERQTELFERQEQDLIAQFVALETALGELQTTSSFLSSQFDSLSSLRNSNS